MLRFPARPVFSSFNTWRIPVQATRYLASPKQPVYQASEEELQEARIWLESLYTKTIPRNIGEMSFSRSSGPGGQNVNKLDTKATLQVPVERLLQYIPSALHSEIRSSRYVVPRSNSIIIKAGESRRQTVNVHTCYVRLYKMIVDAGRKAVPRKTSMEQSNRVKKLQKTENEYRLKDKKQHSAKKSSRRGGSYD